MTFIDVFIRENILNVIENTNFLNKINKIKINKAQKVKILFILKT